MFKMTPRALAITYKFPAAVWRKKERIAQPLLWKESFLKSHIMLLFTSPWLKFTPMPSLAAKEMGKSNRSLLLPSPSPSCLPSQSLSNSLPSCFSYTFWGIPNTWSSHVLCLLHFFTWTSQVSGKGDAGNSTSLQAEIPIKSRSLTSAGLSVTWYLIPALLSFSLLGTHSRHSLLLKPPYPASAHHLLANYFTCFLRKKLIVKTFSAPFIPSFSLSFWSQQSCVPFFSFLC